MPISDYIKKHRQAGTLGNKVTPTQSFVVPPKPVPLSQRNLNKVQTDKSRGTTISQAPAKKVSPLRSLARMLPFGFERNVFDPVAKVGRALFPSPKDVANQIIEENPRISNEQLQSELRKRLSSAGDLPLTKPGEPITENTKIIGLPDIPVSAAIRKVTGKLAGKAADEVKPAARLASEPQPDFLARRSDAEQKLYELETYRDNLKQTITNSPAAYLAKRLGRGDNSLAQLQVNAEKRGGKMANLDDQITELGFRDLDEAQEALDTYRRTKQEVNDLNEVIKARRADFRTAAKAERSELESLDEIAGQTPTMELPTVKSPRPPKPPSKPPRLTARNLPTPGLGRERGFITSVKEAVPEVSQRINGQYIPRSTDELSVKAANLVRSDIKEAERVVAEDLGDKSVATASEMIKYYSRLADEATDAAQKSAYYDKVVETTNKIAARLTEAGREVQAAWILSRQTPEGNLRFLASEINKYNAKNPSRKIPGLSAEEAKKILERSKKIFEMPEGEEKLRAFAEFQNELRSRIPSSLLDKLTTFWRAGLLTGIKTLGLNLMSTGTHAIAEIAKDPVAVLADLAMSAVTGKRSKALSLSEATNGVKEGLKRGATFWKTGYDPREISQAYEATRVHYKNKVLQAYTDYVFRTVAAGDQPFYYGALRRSFAEQAWVTAKNEGLKGDALKKRVKELMENPTDEMVTYATIDAETAVFLNQTALGKIGKKVQEMPGGKFIVPFARTPSAVAMQVLNYSPAGIPLEIIRQITKGTFDQRSMANAIGRSVTGSVPLIWAGGQLFENDRISLDFPKTEREREQWKNEGRTPNSIKIGNEWRQVQVLGPLGPMLLFGAHFKKQVEEIGSPTGAMINAFAGTLKSFTESTFLRGVNDLLEALFGQTGSPINYAASFISSWIPTIINDVARATDPNERVTSEKEFAEAVKRRIIARIPLLRQSLEPQVDTLGREVERSADNPIESMIDPTRPSQIRDNAVTIELRRLSDAGFNASPTRPGDKFGYQALTPEQNTELWTMAGEMVNSKLSKLIKDPRYAALDNEEKAKTIEKFVTASQQNARARMVLSLTQGLTGDALKKELSRLKADGLLSEAVFKEYLRLREGE